MATQRYAMQPTELERPARSPEEGSPCFRATAFGVRPVLLRRFASTAIARVSRPLRCGGWCTIEVEVNRSELFAVRTDAEARCASLRNPPDAQMSLDLAA